MHVRDRFVSITVAHNPISNHNRFVELLRTNRCTSGLSQIHFGEAHGRIWASETLAADAHSNASGGLSWPCLSRGRWCVLLPFLNRHAEFWNVVARPLPPVGFAQADRHRLAFVLDRDHQPGFLLLVTAGAVQHANGFVGTFGDDHAAARLDIDGLPRLVQLYAEGFPITRSCEVDDSRFYRGPAGRILRPFSTKLGVAGAGRGEYFGKLRPTPYWCRYPI